jgi:flagellar motility protein MotE (MotC chaperone)
MFMLAWFTKPSIKTPDAEVAQPIVSAEESDVEKIPEPQASMGNSAGLIDSKIKKAMTEKQLKSLVYEVREKIQEYDNKLEDLKLREQKLRVAGDTLKNDIKHLDDLRLELASTVASLKTERDKLIKSRVEIANIEKSNLVSIAATYDKMDSTQAGKILTNMSQTQSNSADDAVKILYYMSDRTKAKVLASIAETEPTVSAYFCQKLKQIIEGE